MAWPDIYVEVALGAAPMAAISSYTWTDISDRVQSIDIDGPARDTFSGRCQPGRLTVVANNADRGLDPFNGSPAIGGILRPRLPIRVWVVLSGTTHYLFTGYLDDVRLEWLDPAASNVVITATDAFGLLGGAALSTSSFASALTSARVTAVLDAAGWPSADRTIDVGGYELDALTVDGSATALELMQVAHDHEMGSLHIGGDGKVVFRSRGYVIAALGSYSISDALSTDFVDLVAEMNTDYVYNAAFVANASGAWASDSRPGSISTYGTRQWSRTGCQYSGVAALQNVAEYVCDVHSQMTKRFAALTIAPALNDSWNAPLNATIGTGLTVTKTPPGGGSAITRDCVVDGVRHRISTLGSSTQGMWTTTYRLTDLTNSDIVTPDFGFWSLGTWGSSAWFY